MQLTIVVDNNAQFDPEDKNRRKRGIGIWIETGTQNLLFYAGTSEMIEYNIALLDLNINRLDALILGQERWEDAKGLTSVLVNRKQPLPVYHSSGFFNNEKGLATKQHWEKLGADFRIVEAPRELVKNLWVSGPLDQSNAMELYLNTPEGLVVVEGSADSGLEKRIGPALNFTGNERFCGLIGESFEVLNHMKLDFVAASYACGVVMEKSSGKGNAFVHYPVFCGMKMEY